MEVVKRERKKKTKFDVGDRVTVPAEYFDDDSEIDLYYGTVQSASRVSRKVRVKWDIDGAFTDVVFEDLTLQNKTTPKQSASGKEADDVQSSSIQSDFSVATSSTPSTSGCINGRQQQTTKKRKFELKLNLSSFNQPDDSSEDDAYDDDDDDADDDEDEEVVQNVPKKRKPSQFKSKASKDLKKANPSKDITNEDSSDDSPNELDFDESSNSDDGDDNEAGITEKEKEKLILEKSMWNSPGWIIDPRCERGLQPYGPRMNTNGFSTMNELQMCFQFLPINFFTEETLPATNNFAREKTGGSFSTVTLDELIHLFGLLYSMEVQKLPERRMYWNNSDTGIFKGLDYGRIMTRTRFENILSYLQLSHSEDRDQQVLDFINALNIRFQSSVMPGDVLCLDESMIKSFHRNLKGKMKIIRKPRPIGNECKNLCDARSKIVLQIELYEGREFMADKKHVDRVGATTATCLRLTEPWKGTGRVVVGDSWFGSVKSCKELLQTNGLYSILLVKTAHKDYPKLLLHQKALTTRGEWNAVSTEIDGVKMMAVLFKDLKEKQFVSTCSNQLEGKPRITRHHGEIKRPKVAEQYLQMAAGIDIHNHVRTGSAGLEDVWLTKDYIQRQFAGFLGFAFTNAFLAAAFFNQAKEKEETKFSHVRFKIKLANQLVQFKAVNERPSRSLPSPSIDRRSGHKLISLGKRKQGWCYYCRHGQEDKYVRNKTNYYCKFCGPEKPLCSPTTSRQCFEAHIIEGMPSARYRKKGK